MGRLIPCSSKKSNHNNNQKKKKNLSKKSPINKKKNSSKNNNNKIIPVFKNKLTNSAEEKNNVVNILNSTTAEENLNHLSNSNGGGVQKCSRDVNTNNLPNEKNLTNKLNKKISDIKISQKAVSSTCASLIKNNGSSSSFASPSTPFNVLRRRSVSISSSDDSNLTALNEGEVITIGGAAAPSNSNHKNKIEKKDEEDPFVKPKVKIRQQSESDETAILGPLNIWRRQSDPLPLNRKNSSGPRKIVPTFLGPTPTTMPKNIKSNITNNSKRVNKKKKKNTHHTPKSKKKTSRT